MVDELVAIITGIIALYFFVSLVVNLALAQLANTTGDTIGYARALQQGISMVILLAVAASVNVLIPALQTYLSPASEPHSGAEVFVVWNGIARFVVSVSLGVAGIITTLSVVYAGLGAQMSLAAGTPGGVAQSIQRILTLIGGGILSLSSVLLANWLLGLVF